jgi:hypothetical protein
MANILIVANQTLSGSELAEYVRGRMEEGPCEFTLLVPTTAHADLSGPFLAARPYVAVPERDTDADYALARRQLNLGLSRLRELGATVEGDVGDPDPMQAIGEAFSQRSFDEVVVSTLPSTISRWLRQDLPHKVGRKYRVPVAVVTAE